MPYRIALLPLLALMALSACETIAGAGRDLQGAGEVITDEAQETQAEI
jgi:entericidin B